MVITMIVTYAKLNSKAKWISLISLIITGIPAIILLFLHLSKKIDLLWNGILLGIFLITSGVFVGFIVFLLQSGFYYWIKTGPSLEPLFTKIFGFVIMFCGLAILGGLLIFIISILGYQSLIM